MAKKGKKGGKSNAKWWGTSQEALHKRQVTAVDVKCRVSGHNGAVADNREWQDVHACEFSSAGASPSSKTNQSKDYKSQNIEFSSSTSLPNSCQLRNSKKSTRQMHRNRLQIHLVMCPC